MQTLSRHTPIGLLGMLVVCFFLFIPIAFTHAQAQATTQTNNAPKFVSLSGIENLSENPNTKSGIVGYINIIFTLLITVSTMLAVLFIAIAGVKYMATDLIGVKESAKGDIYSALIGLLLILSSVIILETINPCIVSFNIFVTDASSQCYTK